MNSIKRNKKASQFDLIWIIAGFLLVVFVCIFVGIIVGKFNTEIQKMALPTEALTASTQMKDAYMNSIDPALAFLFFGLCFVSIILAILVPINPIFLVFYILELILLIFVSGGLADTYQAVIENSAIASEEIILKLTLTTYIFRYFPLVIFIIGIVLAIIMYKNFRGQQ